LPTYQKNQINPTLLSVSRSEEKRREEKPHTTASLLFDEDFTVLILRYGEERSFEG
jgi:hypothetical protein